MAMPTSVVILHGLQMEAPASVAGDPNKLLPLLFGHILPEDSVSQTLLSLAAQLRHDEAIRLLLDMGIDLTCQTVCGTLGKPSTATLKRGSKSRHNSLDENSVHNEPEERLIDCLALILLTHDQVLSLRHVEAQSEQASVVIRWSVSSMSILRDKTWSSCQPLERVLCVMTSNISQYPLGICRRLLS